MAYREPLCVYPTQELNLDGLSSTIELVGCGHRKPVGCAVVCNSIYAVCAGCWLQEACVRLWVVQEACAVPTIWLWVVQLFVNILCTSSILYAALFPRCHPCRCPAGRCACVTSCVAGLTCTCTCATRVRGQPVKFSNFTDVLGCGVGYIGCIPREEHPNEQRVQPDH